VSGFVEYIQVIISLEESGGGEPSPADISKMTGVLFRWMGSIFLMSILSWIIIVSVETAFHKNTLHGIDHGAFPLRFGVPELRVMLAQFVVYMIVNGVYMAAYFAFIIILLIFVGIGSVLSPTLGAILGTVFGIIGLIAMLGVVLFALARLAPAAALSVRDNEIRLLEGWKLTKTMYWPMIGSYMILWLIGYTVIMVIFLIFAFVAFSDPALYDGFANISENNPEAFSDAISQLLSNPRVYIPLIFGTMITSLMTFILYTATWGVANHAVALDTKKQENLFD